MNKQLSKAQTEKILKDKGGKNHSVIKTQAEEISNNLDSVKKHKLEDQAKEQLGRLKTYAETLKKKATNKESLESTITLIDEIIRKVEEETNEILGELEEDKDAEELAELLKNKEGLESRLDKLLFEDREEKEPTEPAPTEPKEGKDNEAIVGKEVFEKFNSIAIQVFRLIEQFNSVNLETLKANIQGEEESMLEAAIEKLENSGILEVEKTKDDTKSVKILINDEEAALKALENFDQADSKTTTGTRPKIKLEVTNLGGGTPLESTEDDEELEKAKLLAEVNKYETEALIMIKERDDLMNELNKIRYPEGGAQQLDDFLETENGLRVKDEVNALIKEIGIIYPNIRLMEGEIKKLVEELADSSISLETLNAKKTEIEAKRDKMKELLEKQKATLEKVKELVGQNEAELLNENDGAIEEDAVKALEEKRKEKLTAALKSAEAKIVANPVLSEEEVENIFKTELLTAMEEFQATRIKESGFGNTLEKTQNWWDKQGSVKKAIISTTLVAGATALTAGYLDIIPNDQILKRILTRVGIATAIYTAINMAITAGVPANIAKRFKGKKQEGDEAEKESLIRKLFTIKNMAIGLGIGVSWWFSGPIVALVALGGAGARELIDYLYKKVVTESEKKKKGIEENLIALKDLPQDDLESRLIHLSQEYDALAQKLNKYKMYKGLATGASTMTAGLLTLEVRSDELNGLKTEQENPPIAESAPEEKGVFTRFGNWVSGLWNREEEKITADSSSYKYEPEVLKEGESAAGAGIPPTQPSVESIALNEREVMHERGYTPDGTSDETNTAEQSDENAGDNDAKKVLKERLAKEQEAENIRKAELVEKQKAEALAKQEEALKKAQADKDSLNAKVAKGEIKQDAPEVKQAEEKVTQTEKAVNDAKGEATEAKKELEKLTETPEVDEEDIKVNEYAIVDGKKNVGITYAFREQIRHDEELAKALGIDESKLDDDKYMAKVTRDLAIKTGYMDEQGHEVRISKEGMGKISYEVRVDDDGNVIVDEKTLDGNTIETHTQGTDSAKFEVKTTDGIENKGSENYEYSDGKEHHYKDGHEIHHKTGGHIDDVKKGNGPTIVDHTKDGPKIIDQTGGKEVLTYDRYGYDQHGFDRYGYDRDGFNKYGFNRSGYDKEGYDKYGYNKSGKDREYYGASIRHNEEMVKTQNLYEIYTGYVEDNEYTTKEKNDLVHDIFGRGKRDLENIKIWNKAGSREINDFLENDKLTKKEAILGTVIKTLQNRLENEGFHTELPDRDARISTESYLNRLLWNNYVHSDSKEEASKLLDSIITSAKEKLK